MMQLKDRIANGMLFYEHGHKDPVDIEQEQELDALRRHCKEVMFDYNHTRPEDRKKRQELLKGLLEKCGTVCLLKMVSICLMAAISTWKAVFMQISI